MTLISLLIFIIIVGALLYVLGLLPIDGTMKQIGYVAIVVFAVIYLLKHLPAIGL